MTFPAGSLNLAVISGIHAIGKDDFAAVGCHDIDGGGDTIDHDVNQQLARLRVRREPKCRHFADAIEGEPPVTSR
jgi:hypothetical protein